VVCYVVLYLETALANFNIFKVMRRYLPNPTWFMYNYRFILCIIRWRC